MPIQSRIMGTGHFLPERVVTNFDIEKMMVTTDEFIVKRTGIRKRRHADPTVSASDLAVAACKSAVADAGLTMDRIDLLIMNTITPDHTDPACGFFLQAKLGMGTTPVIDIKEQCAGLIYEMAIADQFIKSGMYKHVLCVCSEVLSKRIDGSMDGRNIGILLGDGAGAIVLGPSDDPDVGIKSTILHADGTHAKVLFTEAPGTAMGKKTWIEKDDIDKGRTEFRMDGKTLFEKGVAWFTHAVFESFEANGITMDDLDMFIPHQANLRMIEAIAANIQVPKEKAFVNVEEYGNMASACLPVALDQARKQGRVKPGDLVLLVGFGSGFVWGSALVRM
jgi:3-oxoacyl-[acyl-carrier-protein] synthase III